MVGNTTLLRRMLSLHPEREDELWAPGQTTEESLFDINELILKLCERILDACDNQSAIELQCMVRYSKDQRALPSA